MKKLIFLSLILVFAPFCLAYSDVDSEHENGKAIEYLRSGHDYEHNSTALYNIAYIYEEKGDLENA